MGENDMKRSGLASVLLISAFALLATFVTASSTSATTYYISNGGSDSNNGTSKTTPWAHVPGMPSATGTAGSYSAVPGDTFILRGCDVWYNSNFPMALSHGGSSGNPVTITVDQTWYNTTNCPSAWNRPIFDANTSSSSSAPMEINGSGGQSSGCVGGNGNYFVAFTASYITLSWVEMRNLYYANDAQNTCWAGNGWWRADSVDYITVSNSYEHGWSMGTYSANKVGDADILVWVDGSPACPHCRLDYNVANNCATTHGSGTLPGGSLDFVNVTHSIFKCMSNAIKPIFAGEIGWNEVTLNGESPDPTVHDNVIETVDAQGNGGVYYIHDNRLHDYYSGEGLQVGNPGETDYVWNNSWYGLLQVGGNGPQVPQSETPVAMYFWNNVIVDWGDCINDASHGYSWSGPFYSQNNLCINSNGSNGSGSPSAKPATISNNLGLTDSQATADGYAASQVIPFSPPSSSSVTVGAGANLTSVWPAGFSTADASLICTQQTVNTVVQSVCSGTPNARPASGAWDIGPYQFGAASTTSKLLPPTNLKATVQ
jgi:hypothetical protein